MCSFDKIAIPAVRIMLESMGYALTGTVELKVIMNPLDSYATEALLGRAVAVGKTDVVVLLGNIGWDSEGGSAMIDFKMFEVDSSQLESVEYWSVKTMALYWDWTERFGYLNSLGEEVYKRESVHWEPLMTWSGNKIVQVC